jgi:hypothetical protein
MNNNDLQNIALAAGKLGQATVTIKLEDTAEMIHEVLNDLYHAVKEMNERLKNIESSI